MSHRSQVATSGSSPIAQCSAPWMPPASSRVDTPAASISRPGSVHQTARVRSVTGGSGSGLLADDLVRRHELAHEPDDLVRHLDVAEAQLRLAERAMVNLS